MPHVLQFIDWHFTSYFSESLEGDLQIDFEKCVRYKQGASEDMNGEDHHQQVDIFDNVGKLTAFMVHCVTLCDQFDIQHENDNVKRILNDVVQNIQNTSLDSLGIVSMIILCAKGIGYLNTV